MQLASSLRARPDVAGQPKQGKRCRYAGHRRTYRSNTCRVKDALTPPILEDDAVPSTSALGEVEIELARVQLETVLEKQSAGAFAAPSSRYSNAKLLGAELPALAPDEVLLQTVPSHQWGTGLTVPQFMGALQALPLQKQVRWKSLYPAIGTGSRGKVYQAVNLETGKYTLVSSKSLMQVISHHAYALADLQQP
jgi:hypothetical protein